jgi:hypothetical protein
MPRKPSPSDTAASREWLRRLDRIAADLNVLLVMFAIGLAVLDLTFLLSQRLIDRLPELTRVTYVAQPAAPNVVAGQPDFP